MKLFLASILAVITLAVPVSTFAMDMSWYENDTKLGHRWETDRDAVVREVYRVKTYLMPINGKLTEVHYAIPQNLRAISRYTVCVVTDPTRCNANVHEMTR